MNYPKVVSPTRRESNSGVRWIARYLDQEDGKVVNRSAGTFATKKEAIEQSHNAVDEIRRARSYDLVETDLSLGMFVQEYWLDQRAEEVEHTFSVKSFVELLKLTGLDQKPLSKINRAVLQRFWLEVDQFCMKNERSDSFRSKLRANMNSLLDFAVQNAFIEENYNLNLRVRTARSRKADDNRQRKDLFEKAKNIWSVDQVRKYLPLFRALDRKKQSVDPIMWWAFFNLGIFTGARKGELSGLKFSDFDLEKRTLTIQRSAVVNDTTRSIDIRDPKSSSFGTLHITNEVIEVIQALFLYHEMNGTIDNDYLFQYQTGGLVYPDYWSRMFKRVQIQAGIPEEEILPSCHYMRHTHLSLLAYRGYSMAEIQRRARHSDPRTTAKYYVHILEEKDLEMAERFSDLIKIED